MRRTHPALFLLTIGMVVFAAMVIDELITGWDEDDKEGDESEKEAEPVSIVDTVAQAGRFGTLHVALKNAGLIETLEGDGPYTLFAPTDAAFARLGETLDELLANPERLAQVLKHHVVAGSITAADLADHDELTTLADTTLSVDPGTPPHVGGAGVVESDLTASNGVVHGIDEVLMPPEPTKSRRKKASKSR